MVRPFVFVAVVVLVAFTSCGPRVVVLGEGVPVLAPELASMPVYEYPIDESGDGIELELEACQTTRRGRVTIDGLLNNPGQETDVVLIFALAGIGIEHIRWTLESGKNFFTIDSATFSAEAIDQRLASALSSSTLGDTDCFVSIVATEGVVKWPNAVTTLTGLD